METTMSFAEIVHRRRDARGWRLQTPTPAQLAAAEAEHGDWALLGHPNDPKKQDNDALAALVVEAKAKAWQRYMYLREIDVSLTCDDTLRLVSMAKASPGRAGRYPEAPFPTEWATSPTANTSLNEVTYKPDSTLSPHRMAQELSEKQQATEGSEDDKNANVEEEVDEPSCSSWGGHEICSVHIGNGCLSMVALMALDPSNGFPVGASPAPRAQGERPWMTWRAWGKYLAIVDELARAAAIAADGHSNNHRNSSNSTSSVTLRGPGPPFHALPTSFPDFYRWSQGRSFHGKRIQAEGALDLWLNGSKSLTAHLRDADLFVLPKPAMDLFQLLRRTIVRQRPWDPDPIPPPPPPPPAVPPAGRVEGRAAKGGSENSSSALPTYGDLLSESEWALYRRGENLTGALVTSGASASAASSTIGNSKRNPGGGGDVMAVLDASYKSFLFLQGRRLKVEVVLEGVNFLLPQDPHDPKANLFVVHVSGKVGVCSARLAESAWLCFDHMAVFPGRAVPSIQRAASSSSASHHFVSNSRKNSAFPSNVSTSFSSTGPFSAVGGHAVLEPCSFALRYDSGVEVVGAAPEHAGVSLLLGRQASHNLGGDDRVGGGAATSSFASSGAMSGSSSNSDISSSGVANSEADSAAWAAAQAAAALAPVGWLVVVLERKSFDAAADTSAGQVTRPLLDISIDGHCCRPPSFASAANTAVASSSNSAVSTNSTATASGAKVAAATAPPPPKRTWVCDLSSSEDRAALEYPLFSLPSSTQAVSNSLLADSGSAAAASSSTTAESFVTLALALRDGGRLADNLELTRAELAVSHANAVQEMMREEEGKDSTGEGGDDELLMERTVRLLSTAPNPEETTSGGSAAGTARRPSSSSPSSGPALMEVGVAMGVRPCWLAVHVRRARRVGQGELLDGSSAQLALQVQLCDDNADDEVDQHQANRHGTSSSNSEPPISGSATAAGLFRNEGTVALEVLSTEDRSSASEDGTSSTQLDERLLLLSPVSRPTLRLRLLEETVGADDMASNEPPSSSSLRGERAVLATAEATVDPGSASIGSSTSADARDRSGSSVDNRRSSGGGSSAKGVAEWYPLVGVSGGEAWGEVEVVLRWVAASELAPMLTASLLASHLAGQQLKLLQQQQEQEQQRNHATSSGGTPPSGGVERPTLARGFAADGSGAGFPVHIATENAGLQPAGGPSSGGSNGRVVPTWADVATGRVSDDFLARGDFGHNSARSSRGGHSGSGGGGRAESVHARHVFGMRSSGLCMRTTELDLAVLHGIIASLATPFRKTFTVGKAMRGLAKVGKARAKKAATRTAQSTIDKAKTTLAAAWSKDHGGGASLGPSSSSGTTPSSGSDVHGDGDQGAASSAVDRVIRAEVEAAFALRDSLKIGWLSPAECARLLAEDLLLHDGLIRSEAHADAARILGHLSNSASAKDNSASASAADDSWSSSSKGSRLDGSSSTGYSSNSSRSVSGRSRQEQRVTCGELCGAVSVVVNQESTHAGSVVARAGEFAAMTIAAECLGPYKALPLLLARHCPVDPLVLCQAIPPALSEGGGSSTTKIPANNSASEGKRRASGASAGAASVEALHPHLSAFWRRFCQEMGHAPDVLADGHGGLLRPKEYMNSNGVSNAISASSSNRSQPLRSPPTAAAVVRAAILAQRKLLRCFDNFRFAKAAWHHLIVPALHGLPSVGHVRAPRSQLHYLPMAAPVSKGTLVYVDSRVVRIVGLPPPLRRLVLTGIMTAHRDRAARGGLQAPVRASAGSGRNLSTSGSSNYRRQWSSLAASHSSGSSSSGGISAQEEGGPFLWFTLTRPATLLLCVDARCRHRPAWMQRAGFVSTPHFVHTTVGARFRVLALSVRGPPGADEVGAPYEVSLGANEDRRYFQYFVLIAPENAAATLMLGAHGTPTKKAATVEDNKGSEEEDYGVGVGSPPEVGSTAAVNDDDDGDGDHRSGHAATAHEEEVEDDEEEVSGRGVWSAEDEAAQVNAEASVRAMAWRVAAADSAGGRRPLSVALTSLAHKRAKRASAATGVSSLSSSSSGSAAATTAPPESDALGDALSGECVDASTSGDSASSSAAAAAASAAAVAATAAAAAERSEVAALVLRRSLEVNVRVGAVALHVTDPKFRDRSRVGVRVGNIQVEASGTHVTSSTLLLAQQGEEAAAAAAAAATAAVQERDAQGANDSVHASSTTAAAADDNEDASRQDHGDDDHDGGGPGNRLASAAAAAAAATTFGIHDELRVSASANGQGTYFNGRVGAQEFFWEPCSGSMQASKRGGSDLVRLQLVAPQHACVNVSSALVDQAASIADNVRLAKRRNTGRHYDDDIEGSAGGGDNSSAANSNGNKSNFAELEEVRARQRASAHAAFEAATMVGGGGVGFVAPAEASSSSSGEGAATLAGGMASPLRPSSGGATISSATSTTLAPEDAFEAAVDAAMEAMAESAAARNFVTLDNLVGSSCEVWLENKHAMDPFGIGSGFTGNQEGGEAEGGRADDLTEVLEVPSGSSRPCRLGPGVNSLEPFLLSVHVAGFAPVRDIPLSASGVLLFALRPAAAAATTAGGGRRNNNLNHGTDQEGSHLLSGAGSGLGSHLALAVELRGHASSQQAPVHSGSGRSLGMVIVRTNVKFVNKTAQALDLQWLQPATANNNPRSLLAELNSVVDDSGNQVPVETPTQSSSDDAHAPMEADSAIEAPAANMTVAGIVEEEDDGEVSLRGFLASAPTVQPEVRRRPLARPAARVPFSPPAPSTGGARATSFRRGPPLESSLRSVLPGHEVFLPASVLRSGLFSFRAATTGAVPSAAAASNLAAPTGTAVAADADIGSVDLNNHPAMAASGLNVGFESVALPSELFDANATTAFRRHAPSLDQLSLALTPANHDKGSSNTTTTSTGGGGASDNSSGLRNGAAEKGLLDWALAALPPYTLVNALPCALAFEMLQPNLDDHATNHTPPGSSSSAMGDLGARWGGGDKMGGGVSTSSSRDYTSTSRWRGGDGSTSEAVALFAELDRAHAIAADAFSRHPSSQVLDEGVAAALAHAKAVRAQLLLCQGEVALGGELEVTAARLDRPLYLRVKLAGAKVSGWSPPMVFARSAHGDRDGVWRDASEAQRVVLPPLVDEWSSHSSGSGSGGGAASSTPTAAGAASSAQRAGGKSAPSSPSSGPAPEVRLARIWKPGSGRRLLFHSRYWIVNKTSVALWYHAEAAKLPSPILAPSNSSSSQQQKSSQHGQQQRGSGGGGGSSGADSGTYTGGPAVPATDGYLPTDPATRAAASAAYKAIRQEASLFSDGQNLEYFGPAVPDPASDVATASGVLSRANTGIAAVPVLLDCPRQKLRLMPYGHAAQSCLADLLYAYNIEVGGSGRTVSDPAMSPADKGASSSLGGHSSSSASSHMAPFGSDRDGGYRMKTAFAVGDRAYVDGAPPSGVVTALPEVLAHRPQLVAILTRDADRTVGYDVEDHLSFRVSCDADVYVCYDAHARKPAPWLRLAGFRGTSSRVRTSDGVYALHHRFYAKVNHERPVVLRSHFFFKSEVLPSLFFSYQCKCMPTPICVFHHEHTLLLFSLQGTTVRLGGAEARSSVKETRNYFVLMTTPDREGGDATTTSGGGGGGPGWGGGGGITRGPELAVDGIVAMRSMAEQVCRVGVVKASLLILIG